MLPLYGSAALICAASAVVGEAAARLCGREPWRGYAPAVGLALLLALTAAAIRLPGDGTTSAVITGIACALALAFLVRRGPRPPRPRPELLAAVAGVVLLTAVPFIANDRFGILGVSYYDDLATHLSWTLSLLGDPTAALPTAGYPLGPHSLVGTVSTATGADLDWAFTGLLVAVPLLSVPAALSLLDGLGPLRRGLAAVLVALPYLAGSYFTQSSFKEPIVALLFLAFVVVLREMSRGPGLDARGGLLLGALTAGCVQAFSYGALVWLAATGILWLALEALGGRRLRGAAVLRPATGAFLAAGGAAVFLLLPEIPRILDLINTFGGSPAAAGSIPTSNLGSLAGPIPAREVFGLWPREDYRFAPSPDVKNALTLLGAAVTGAGGLWWLKRRDFAVPAAVAAAGLVYLRLKAGESPYIAAKGLAVAAPLVTAMGVRALFTTLPPALPRLAEVPRLAVAAAFVGIALWSTFLVLRGGQVGPRSQLDELGSLRPELAGKRVLFLGNDDYIPWELRGARLTVPSGAGITVGGPRLPLRTEKAWTYGQPFDFDSVVPSALNDVDYVVAPRTSFASQPPANFRLVSTTGSFRLYRRSGPTPGRQVLAEGPSPGAVLDCRSRLGRRLRRTAGWASVRPRPVFVPLSGFALPLGTSRAQGLELPPGRWELSLQYTSPQSVAVQAPGMIGSVPGYLGRPGPWWRVGQARSVATAPRRVLFRQEHPSPLFVDSQLAILTGVSAVRSDRAARLVPLRRACGRYVDWFTVGPSRPRS